MIRSGAAAIEAPARPQKRFAAAFGDRFFTLLAVSLLWIGPILYDRRFVAALAAWNLFLFVTWIVDLARLPAPSSLSARRTWLAPVSLSVASTVRLTIVNRSQRAIVVRVLDAVPRELSADPPVRAVVVGPSAQIHVEYPVVARERGQMAIGGVFLRYQSAFGLAERWARVDLDQTVVSYPNLDEARRESIHRVQRHETDIEHQSRAMSGSGRLFHSLREHQPGDEFRDICWTASARRGKLVTRTYEIERSQPIWIVVDSGRLMRARVGGVSKLDLAVNAALTLSQVALGSGDRVGLLVYGRRIAERRPPARGAAHLAGLLDTLALVRAEEGEADHLRAAGRLLTDQKQRSLVVWMTDVPDAAITPDVVRGASLLMPRHLVVFVMIGQPDLDALVEKKPSNVQEMFAIAAGHEVVRRRNVLIAGLRERGALAVEMSGPMSAALVNTYLDVKQRNRL